MKPGDSTGVTLTNRMLVINLPGGTLVSEELCCIADHTCLILLLSAHWAAFPPWKPLKCLQTCFVENMGARQQHLKYNSEPVCDESSTRKTKKLISRLYIVFDWSKRSPSVYSVYCLRVLSHGKSVCVLMHGCQCMYLLLSVICLEERRSHREPQWAVWDRDKGLLYLWDGAFYRLKAELRSNEA